MLKSNPYIYLVNYEFRTDIRQYIKYNIITLIY